MAANRVPVIQNHSSKVQLERISHVYFEHSDLEKFGTFATDFGLVEAYRDEAHILYRGYGVDPYCYVARRSEKKSSSFYGSAWVAQTQSEFDKAAALDGAVISDLSPFPGGGKKVTLKSPSGFFMNVIFGQEERVQAAEPLSAQVENFGPLNGSLNRQRFGEFQRFHPGPAMVHKLGHFGCIVNDWAKEMDWYTSNFNLVPSDVQHAPDNEDLDVIAFMHLDLGKRFTDHHSMFLARAQPGENDRMHHTSFEIENFDTQLLGHEWLASEGYTAVWGVGRHILGSQIFDYWKDPSGFTIEHYADGDLVNTDIPTMRSAAGPLAIWGPEFPKDFSEDTTRAFGS